MAGEAETDHSCVWERFLRPGTGFSRSRGRTRTSAPGREVQRIWHQRCRGVEEGNGVQSWGSSHQHGEEGMGLGGRASWGVCLARGQPGWGIGRAASSSRYRGCCFHRGVWASALARGPIAFRKLQGSLLLLVHLTRIALKPYSLASLAGTQNGSSSAWLFFTVYIVVFKGFSIKWMRSHEALHKYNK